MWTKEPLLLRPLYYCCGYYRIVVKLVITCSGFVDKPSCVVGWSLNGYVVQNGNAHAGMRLQAERQNGDADKENGHYSHRLLNPSNENPTKIQGKPNEKNNDKKR